MSHNPTLAILLFLAASVGKIGATLFMVPLGRLGWRQTLTIGVGLDARLTTEIVVARLLILILVLAAVISVAVGGATDAITIFAIIVLNGALGFAREWKAERALEALRNMLSPRCKVIRDSREQDIDATQLVTDGQLPAQLCGRARASRLIHAALEMSLRAAQGLHFAFDRLVWQTLQRNGSEQ